MQLNTLYWHIVDSHSFPLEVSAFPELSQKGAYSAAQVYSEDDVQDVISFAAAVLLCNKFRPYRFVDLY